MTPSCDDIVDAVHVVANNARQGELFKFDATIVFVRMSEVQRKMALSKLPVEFE